MRKQKLYYYVAIQIKRFSDSDYRHRLCLIAGTFSSVSVKSDEVSLYGFNVFFDSPVDIKKGVKHRLEAPSFLAPPILVLVKMVNILWCVQGLDLILWTVRRVPMERELNEGNFQNFFLL